MPDATEKVDSPPLKLAVDGAGFVWRVYDEHWSMAPLNPDNEPVPESVRFYVPLEQVERLIAVARRHYPSIAGHVGRLKDAHEDRAAAEWNKVARDFYDALGALDA